MSDDHGYCVEDHDWVECWDCGGEGSHDYMCECERFVDTCCCLVPTPMRCSTCRGKGGWFHKPKEQGE